jgi:ComF family protein
MVYGMLERLFTEVCPACGCSSRAGFCAPCGRRFARLGQACPYCALPLPRTTCPKLTAAWHVDFLTAPFAYAAPLDHFVLKLKFHQARRLGRALGLLLAAELPAGREPVDALVPMPLHPARLRERGYNQAMEIARGVAAATELALLHRGIRRVRATTPQTGSDAAHRRWNVAGAFAVERPLAGLRLAVIDDVVTTGATINALARELKSAGAAAVVGWAVARTP